MSEKSRIVVVKVGGSLLEWHALPDRLTRFLDVRRNQGDKLLLIAGGGAAANWIRKLDRVHKIGESRAHELAVRSLDLTAYALQILLPETDVIQFPEEFTSVWKSNRIPILAPRIILIDKDQNSPDPLPKSWDNTTDSIAATIATILHAGTLILLKSTSVDAKTTREQAANLGVVDPLFPRASQGLQMVTVVNLRDTGMHQVELLP